MKNPKDEHVISEAVPATVDGKKPTERNKRHGAKHDKNLPLGHYLTLADPLAKEMTLRDHFAGLAMAAIVGCFRESASGRNGIDRTPGERTSTACFNSTLFFDGEEPACSAKEAYAIADAMLSERYGRLDLDLDASIEKLGLSTRASNALSTLEVQTVRQLFSKTENELRYTRSLGVTSLEEIMEKLRIFVQR